MRKHDLTGVRFGRWTVIKAAPRTTTTRWWCRCSCGVERTVSAPNLTFGKSTSCGCLREEGRPSLAKLRDFKGAKNPRAAINLRKYGENYVPSDSVWYKRAAGVFYNARKKGIPLGFGSAVEFAAYVKSIAPSVCPVFEREFSERGAGFDRWSPSIDKINPKLGYVKGNIQIISMLANCMKRDASEVELRSFAKWVLES